jgi:hypothetical protein
MRNKDYGYWRCNGSDNISIAIWQMALEKIEPAIWEICPAQGNSTLLFGKNLTVPSAGIK